MLWFANCVLLCMIATQSVAVFLPEYLLDNIKDIEKKLSHDFSLSARLFSEKVLEYEERKGNVNSKIPDLAKSLGLSSLLGLVDKAGLVATLSGPGPLTVFGPTNKAFSNLPAWTHHILANNTLLSNLLKFHVLPTSFPSTSIKDELLVSTALKGKSLRINVYTDAAKNAVTVITAQCAPIDLKSVDNKASNGLIHVINSVMIPPMGNIVESLVECPVFKTLTQAVKVAQLGPALGGDGPFTVFAPTDKAFAKLPPGALDKLLKNVTALRYVLEYHVVKLTYCSPGLGTGLYSEITTLANHNITVTLTPEGVKVNNANVIVADGSVSNGVIHAIDTVLLPPDFK